MIAKLLVLATIVLFILKLAGVAFAVALSWWLVFTPLLVAVGLTIIGLLIYGGMLKLIDKLADKFK